jgi:hypothetical protein
VRALALAIVAALAACSDDKPTIELAHDTIKVSTNAHMRTDLIGDPAAQREASFVLVDAENTNDRPATVTLAGHLVGADGAPIPLKPEALTIPPGESRTFILIDSDFAPRPDARGAEVSVRGAIVARPVPIAIADVHTFPDGDRVVIAGSVINNSHRPATIVVMAGFHDAAGKPLARPFTVFRLGHGHARTVRLVGPPGSTRAAMYTGDVTF